MSDYKTITEWETYEGAVTGYNDSMVAVIEIAALQNRDQCLRWNTPYVSGRYWYVTHEDGTYTEGQAANVRAARKDALRALEEGPAR